MGWEFGNGGVDGDGDRGRVEGGAKDEVRDTGMGIWS